MKLSEVLDHLSFGELSQVHLGNDGEAFGITDDNRFRVITHINMGLAELHKRFFLREGRAVVYLAPGLMEYSVNEDDLYRIEQVLDDQGEALPLNQEGKAKAVFTPTVRSLRLTEPLDSQILTVVYRANHPTLSTREAARDPERTEIDLPRSHLEALVLYVASRVLNPMGANVEFHEGNNYHAKFEAACQLLELGGFRIDQQYETDRFRRQGFV